MADIDSLVIRISSDASAAATGIDRLTESMVRLKAATTGGLKGLDKYADKLKKIRDAVNGVSLFGSGGTNPTAAQGAAKPVEAITSAAKQAGDAVPKMGNSLKDALVRIKKFGGGENEATKASGNLIASLNKLGESFAKMGKLMLMRSALRALISGFREGIDNLYQWSKAIDGHFSHSMDEAASTLMYLKNGIATAVAPALQALIPILTAVTNAFVKALNAIHMFFAALMGQGTITIAKQTTEEYASSLDKAGKAAKRLKDLLGFDEINRLSAPNSGSGGASAAVNYEDMFDYVKVTEKMKKLAEILRPILTIVTAIGAAFLVWQNIIKPIKAGWTSVLTFFTKIKTILEGITGKDLLAMSAIGLVIVGLVESLKRHWDEFKTGVISVVVDLGIPERIEAIQKKIEPILTLLKNIFSFAWQMILDIGSIIGSTLISGALSVLIGTFNSIITIIGQIFSAFSHVVEAIKKLLKGDFWGFFEEMCRAAFDLYGAVVLGVVDFFKGIWGGVRGMFNTIGQDIVRLINDLLKGLNSAIRWINKTFNLNLQQIGLMRWGGSNSNNNNNSRGNGTTTDYQYASGGWPVTGQMFIAREAGPELVGTIGGKTAVATNNDIVAAVSQGVASAVGAVLGGRSSERNISVNVDGRALFDIMVNQNNTLVRQRGASPLLV